MPDELKGKVAANTLINGIICAGSLNGMDISETVVVEQIVDSAADFARTISKKALAEMEIAQQGPIIIRDRKSFVLQI